MASTPTPPPAAPVFDAICANVGEWDPLPTVRPLAPGDGQPLDEERQSATLDRLIFAGLVSPL